MQLVLDSKEVNLRRIAPWILLLVFLTHQFGYIGVYWFAKSHISQKWQATSEYHGQITEVKIPFTIPYWMDQDEFQPADGLFEHNGKFYRKVAQRYAEGFIHIRLVEDFDTQHLHNSIAGWIQSITDDNADQGTTSTVLAKMFFAKDYFQQTFNSQLENHWEIFPTKQFAYFFSIKESIPDSDTPPPLV